MPQYAAVLGHQPHISIAELAATVPGFVLESIEEKIIALFSSDEELDTELMDSLGGTVLLVERITEADVTLKDIPQIIAKEASSIKKKVTFGLRCYNVPKNLIKAAYFGGKQALKDAGKPCRYVGNERKPAATALLHDSDMLSGKKGFEIFVLRRPNELWVGKTIGAQDVDTYTWRDMEKPVRDTTVGLLPPKLAQTMLNMGAWLVRSQTPEPKPKKDAKKKRKKKEIYTVFDPFCGTGVIPLECMLRNWHVIASDVSQKAVNGTQKNLEWIRKEKKILKKDVTEEVFKHDATKAFKLKTMPDMVVTETTLGPNLSKKSPSEMLPSCVTTTKNSKKSFYEMPPKTYPVCHWSAPGRSGDLVKNWFAWRNCGPSLVISDMPQYYLPMLRLKTRQSFPCFTNVKINL